MSITISGLLYHHPNKQPLFSGLNLTISDADKVSLIGNNGIGKSTLLKLIAGKLSPTSGSILCSSTPYYIPQHVGMLENSVAEALQIDKKLSALNAITQGSVDPIDYEVLDDDWEIESRGNKALSHWELDYVNLSTPMYQLSGGERTKVFLAGLLIHKPEIILLDEPTNHLDLSSRELLYEYIESSNSTIMVVSHDITLLNLLDTTYEFSIHGIKLYGGNYDFYREQKNIETSALQDSISAEEKALRIAQKKAKEVKERQEKRTRQGEKNKQQLVRALRKKKLNAGENTAAKLGDKHSEIISNHRSTLSELRQKQDNLDRLKTNFNNSSLHANKLLIRANSINFAYDGEKELWSEPIELEVFSNDRIHLMGNNGSGKTTLVKLLLGELMPTSGTIDRAEFNYIYLDQSYKQMDMDCSIVEMAENYNTQHLEEHEIKIRLNRFLFPPDTWDKKCTQLSGGEKMRLYLCCLMISNHTPDIIILDEPTNNLDIASLEIITNTIRDYKGCLIVISHDSYFINEIGITANVNLTPFLE